MDPCWLILAAALLLPSPPGDFDQARTYYEASQAPGLSAEARADLLRRSLDAHPTFRARYDLGKLQREGGDLDAARHSFEAAFELTDQDRYMAQAAYQVAVTWIRMGHFVEARQWLRRSLAYESHPATRRALREIELSRKGEVISAEEIVRELRVTRSFGVAGAAAARAELRVNFEINEARLDATGLRQARELARALRDPSVPKGIFLLLGHTDLQCPRSSPGGSGCDLFNYDLSERRAGAVGAFLNDSGISGDRIRTLGCGRHHPLSSGGSADDHYLNRRVVVMVTSRPDDDRNELCATGTGLL